MTTIEIDPIAKFRAWYDHAGKMTLWRCVFTKLYPPAVIHQPDAMVLSTVGPGGAPSARVVLFKGLKDGGFKFYTNFTSRKGRELGGDPRVALTFHWNFPERQIRVEGDASRLSRDESVSYWRSRPRGSQASGYASPQSDVIASREALVDRVREIEREFEGREIPCPESWGGFVVHPRRIEFWELRVNRLHEREVFTRDGARWRSELLAP